MTTRLINDECIKTMQELIDEDIKVDLILTDPPYGTIKGLSLDGYKNRDISWDTPLNLNEMFECCESLLKQSKCCILFSQEPYTNEIRHYNANNLPFIYPYIWLKDHFANSLSCKKAPVSYFEDISVFRKKYDLDSDSTMREYSKRLFQDINVSKKEIMTKCGNQGLDHFFRFDSMQFSLPTEKNYQKLIDYYGIDNFDYFIPYDDLIRGGG